MKFDGFKFYILIFLVTNLYCSKFTEIFQENMQGKDVPANVRDFLDQYSDDEIEINGSESNRLRVGIWNILSVSLYHAAYELANTVLANNNFSKRAKQQALHCILRNNDYFKENLTDIMHVLLNHGAALDEKNPKVPLPTAYHNIKKEESSQDGTKFFTNNGRVGKKGDLGVSFYEPKKSKNKNMTSDGSIDTFARALKSLC